MRNVLNIILHDFRRLTASVVGIVVLLGLIVIPSVFTWFNILSNWDPFEKEATGNIPIAVVIEDEGMEALGLELNVGDTFRKEVEANDQIDWQLLKTREDALEGVRSGKCYAAVVVPEDFTARVLSFTTGELKNPRILYYENDKKNAIANKVTDTLRKLLRDKINEAFINTIGQYVAEAAEAADSNSLDPQDVFTDLGRKMTRLGEDLDGTIATINAAVGLSVAAQELLQTSDDLVGSSQKTLEIGDNLLDSAEKKVPSSSDADSINKNIKKIANSVSSNSKTVRGDLEDARSSMASFNDYVDNKLDKDKAAIGKTKESVDKVIVELNKLGLTGLASRFQTISDKLGSIYDRLDNLEKATAATWDDTKAILDSLIEDLGDAGSRADSIPSDITEDVDKKLAKATKNARKAIKEVKSSLDKSYGGLSAISGALGDTEKALKTLNGGLKGTADVLVSVQNGCNTLAEVFNSFSNSDVISDLNDLKADGTQIVASRMASPITMKTEELYAMDNFGSTMAAFYTTVALWVGALLAAVMIKSQVRRREGMPAAGLTERFFGRYRLFLMIGLAQALLMSLGTLFFVGIDCAHPWLFLLASCVIGAVFTLIIFSLVFAFESIGLAISVILLIVQVAGGGGTFPVQVLPKIFQDLYPLMPMRYGMDALREAVSGTYGHTYIKCLAILVLMAAVATAIGLLLHKPMRILIDMVEKSKEESGIML